MINKSEFWLYMFCVSQRLICVCRSPSCSPGPCGWTWIPLRNTVMKNCGKRWNSLIWRSLWATRRPNSTWSAPKEEKTSGTSRSKYITSQYIHQNIMLFEHSFWTGWFGHFFRMVQNLVKVCRVNINMGRKGLNDLEKNSHTYSTANLIVCSNKIILF